MKISDSFKMMVISLFSTFFALTWAPAAHSGQQDTPTDAISSGYIVHYFYTSKRCTTCRKIEQWSEEAVKDLVEAGQVQWQALNIDLPENEHFIKDFQLFTKSVIVAEYKDGKPVRWKNLPDIWTLVRDREKFVDYVADETKNFMGNH